MRNLQQFVFCAAIMLGAAQAKAQLVITESFKIAQSCASLTCKKEVESILIKQGARAVELDMMTSTLTIAYDPKKITDVPAKVQAAFTKALNLPEKTRVVEAHTATTKKK